MKVRIIKGLLIGLGAITCGAGMAQAESGFAFNCGQSSRVWKVLRDVKGAEKDLVKINRILNENFGNYETAFSSLGPDFDVATLDQRWINKIRIGLLVEAAAVGLVQNPVLPELQAAATAVTTLRASVNGTPFENLFFEAGLIGGWGIERRLSAVSTDLIEKIPFQKDDVRLYGGDIFMRKRWQREVNLWALQAGWKGTAYRGLEGQTSLALDRKLRDFTHWWQGRADFSHSNWGIHGIAGSHPLPFDVLPRVWDRVANTNAWRELGAMTGAGAEWRLHALSLLGGFYGGYLGGAVTWNASQRTYLRVQTFGIENSSAYRTLGQRVYSLGSYFAF